MLAEATPLPPAVMAARLDSQREARAAHWPIPTRTPFAALRRFAAVCPLHNFPAPPCQLLGLLLHAPGLRAKGS